MSSKTKNFFKCPNCGKTAKMIKEPSLKMIDAMSMKIEGKSNKKIAEIMNISESTVRDYQMNYKKRRRGSFI